MGLDMNFYKGKAVTVEEISLFNKYCEDLDKEIDRIYGRMSESEMEKADIETIERDAKPIVLSNLGNPNNIDEIIEKIDQIDEIKYFRKHSDLHGYLSENFSDQADGEDNCVYYVLDREDIENIRSLADKELSSPGSAEEHQGFFWGKSTKEDWEETLEMCDELLNSMKDDEALYYGAWY